MVCKESSHPLSLSLSAAPSMNVKSDKRHWERRLRRKGATCLRDPPRHLGGNILSWKMKTMNSPLCTPYVQVCT